jgi:hypothetical protein
LMSVLNKTRLEKIVPAKYFKSCIQSE